MTLSIHIACAGIYVVSTRKPPLLISSVPLPILYMSIIILKFQNDLAICLRVGCNASSFTVSALDLERIDRVNIKH